MIKLAKAGFFVLVYSLTSIKKILSFELSDC